MYYDKCKLCGRYGFMDTHRCPPRWEVEYDGEFHTFYAIDAGEAAGIFVAQYDYGNGEGDYYVARGKTEIEVKVSRIDGGKAETYVVSGEFAPKYHASKKG